MASQREGRCLRNVFCASLLRGPDVCWKGKSREGLHIGGCTMTPEDLIVPPRPLLRMFFDRHSSSPNSCLGASALSQRQRRREVDRSIPRGYRAAESTAEVRSLAWPSLTAGKVLLTNGGEVLLSNRKTAAQSRAQVPVNPAPPGTVS